jgi:hypothetical protein
MLKYISVRFEIPTAMSVKLAIFWVLAPCRLVEIYQCFRAIP